LQSQLSTLEGLKHRGISQEELCDIVLRVLRLVTATVTFEYTLGEAPIRRATLHYENVGYVFHDTKQVYELSKSTKQLDEELEQRFALPEPARESLLSVVITILEKSLQCLSFFRKNEAHYSLARPFENVAQDGTLLGRTQDGTPTDVFQLSNQHHCPSHSPLDSSCSSFL
jgi:hypothetical protein